MLLCTASHAFRIQHNSILLTHEMT